MVARVRATVVAGAPTGSPVVSASVSPLKAQVDSTSSLRVRAARAVVMSGDDLEARHAAERCSARFFYARRCSLRTGVSATVAHDFVELRNLCRPPPTTGWGSANRFLLLDEDEDVDTGGVDPPRGRSSSAVLSPGSQGEGRMELVAGLSPRGHSFSTVPSPGIQDEQLSLSAGEAATVTAPPRGRSSSTVPSPGLQDERHMELIAGVPSRGRSFPTVPSPGLQDERRMELIAGVPSRGCSSSTVPSPGLQDERRMESRRGATA